MFDILCMKANNMQKENINHNKIEIQQYSLGEEIANSITHGLGIIFSIVGLTVLMFLSSYFGTKIHFISYLIYGLSMITLYTCSTLYHAIPFAKAKKILKTCDHAAIYLMIAGTYTPFLIINIKKAEK